MNTKLLLLLLLITVCITGCKKDTVTSNNLINNSAELRKQPINTIETATNSTSLPAQTPNPKGKPQSIGEVIDYGSYGLTDKFSEIIRSNNIDQDYYKEFNSFQNSSNFSANGWIQFEAKYADIWDIELNQIYKKVIAKLDQKQKDLLVESQKGWLQNHLKETEFIESTFETDSENNIGSQGRVNMEIAIKKRLRDRTIQLMEYYHMLGGEVQFVYRGK